MAKAPQGAKEANGERRSLSILAQYVKDFSFENPRAPDSLRPRPDERPDLDIRFNVGARELEGSDREVILQIDALARIKDEVIFNVELAYAGVFRLEGVSEDALEQALMIEGPHLLFPFARRIVAEAIRDGGFPPLMIEPVDFGHLYRLRKQRDRKPPASDSN